MSGETSARSSVGSKRAGYRFTVSPWASGRRYTHFVMKSTSGWPGVFLEVSNLGRPWQSQMCDLNGTTTLVPALNPLPFPPSPLDWAGGEPGFRLRS